VPTVRLLGLSLDIFGLLQVVVIVPGTDGVALTTGTVERTIFPPSRMDIGVARVGVEELV
jgi:hypothetical protein